MRISQDTWFQIFQGLPSKLTPSNKKREKYLCWLREKISLEKVGEKNDEDASY